MTQPRRAAFATLVALALALAGLIIWTTPWHPLPGGVPGGRVHADAARDFTAAQIATAQRYHDTIRPWGLAGLSLAIVVPALLGLTPIGARLIDRTVRWRWSLRIVVAVAGVTLLGTLATLPLVAREHAIQREFGLTRQGWAGWLSDAGRGYLVALVTTAIAVLVVVGLARRLPRRWWLPAAAAGAALVIGGSFVYPYVVEPLFNRFHSLPDSPLRHDLLALAARDHVHVSDVLVSDASRRTTTENAYVSGFGSSRRIVIYDTLLERDPPPEVELVVAHELGHAKRNDVLHGTVEGAIAVAAAMCAAYLLLGARAGDPRMVPRLIALYVVASFAMTPVQNLVSRQIEARADAHALMLTRDPATFIQAMKQLATTGLDDLEPSKPLYVLFFSHPSVPERIAMARDWARQHDVALP